MSVLRKWNSRLKVPFVCDAPSLTHQSFAESSDVNVIIRRYQQGVVPCRAARVILLMLSISRVRFLRVGFAC